MSEPAPVGLSVHLFHLAYSQDTLAACPPGFEVLDNLANPRPDWYEYGPVRRLLIDGFAAGTLDDDAFYGFFSPKFHAKTGWHATDIRQLVQAPGTPCDVALCSAHPNQIAFFLNVFEQGEHFHPGLLATCQQWLQSAGVQVPLNALVMDVRQMVFCNYFVAKPAFWRQWLQFGEHLFAVCEGRSTPLQQALTASTDYVGGTQMKIFVMERLASLVLALQPQWRVRVADPYHHGRWPSAARRDDPTSAICSDALKHAHASQSWGDYMGAFGSLRQRVLQGRA